MITTTSHQAVFVASFLVLLLTILQKKQNNVFFIVVVDSFSLPPPPRSSNNNADDPPSPSGVIGGGGGGDCCYDESSSATNNNHPLKRRRRRRDGTATLFHNNKMMMMDRRSLFATSAAVATTTTAGSLLLLPPPPKANAASAAAAAVAQQQAESTTRRLWLDTDPSGFIWTGLDCDDDLAILVTLALAQEQQQSPPQQQPHKIKLQGISICGGNAPLRHTRQDIKVLLEYANANANTNYYEGYGWKDMQISRQYLQYMNRYLQPDIPSSKEATQAIIKAAAAAADATSDENKLTILTLGPPTNLAKAIQQNPTIMNSASNSNIDHVYMMGGELTGHRMDLNFNTDRAAARTVVNAANIPKTLIPIQLCAQIVLDEEFVNDFEQSYCSANDNTAAACALVPKMKQQIQTMPELVNRGVLEQKMPLTGRWKPSPNLDKGFIPWDIVAVLAVAYPQMFDEWEYHKVEFPTCDGGGEPCDRTMMVQDLPKEDWPTTTSSAHHNYNHSGIVRIPHVIRNETEMKLLIKELLGKVKARKQNPPRIMPGFLTPIIGLGGLVGGTITAAIATLIGKRLGG